MEFGAKVISSTVISIKIIAAISIAHRYLDSLIWNTNKTMMQYKKDHADAAA
jgi:hypothetical protein